MKLKTIKLVLQFANLLSVCCHAGVVAIRLPHDLVDNELRATADVKMLNHELSSNAQVVDECLIFHHIVGRTEVQSNHVKESISLRGDQHYATPDPVKSEGAIKIHASVLLGDGGLLRLGPFSHEIHQSLGLDHRLWDIGYVKPTSLRTHLAILPMARWSPIISSSPYEATTRIRWLPK
jgi:hypothetical protein